MCGIFGVIAKDERYNRKKLIKLLEELAEFSQVRGKDSSGLAFKYESTSEIDILKGPVSISELFRTDEYKRFKTSILNEVKSETDNKIFAALGHARLVTNGSQLEDVNNQPVVKDGIVGIHNGIIINEEELWGKHPNLKREYEIDTEVFFSVFRHYLNVLGNTILALKQTNKELLGTISAGFFINDREEFIVYTNNGSLYILTNNEDLFIFGSEKDILNRLVKKNHRLFDKSFILKQVSANKGFLLGYKDFSLTEFDLTKDEKEDSSFYYTTKISIKINNFHPNGKQLHAVVDPNKFKNGIKADSEKKLLEYNIDKINSLKRCTRCVLPETFPFIEFNNEGVCNICNNYVKKNQSKSIEELQELVAKYRKKDGKPDCLVPFSGGRDSTYVLHMVKNILKMNPIAFTYDWGMVTDLGRRNIARVTGKLGVENIIVSADIRWKRENIRKNITAWIKNPRLGMIPLFMAGDKYFFYFCDKVKRQNDIKLNIWGINSLENTDFKVGFSGLPLRFNKKRIYSISIKDQLKLFNYVGKNILENHSYINQSIFDTFGSFASRYFAPKNDYFHLFDYCNWDEKEIEDLIINEYKWETAIDAKTTWRIGDGTAAFYNYIYYTVAGFSENDTFRSNQIREGMLTREKALVIINEENKPRFESLKWYLEIIGLDFNNVIKTINNITKLY